MMYFTLKIFDQIKRFKKNNRKYFYDIKNNTSDSHLNFLAYQKGYQENRVKIYGFVLNI